MKPPAHHRTTAKPAKHAAARKGAPAKHAARAEAKPKPLAGKAARPRRPARPRRLSPGAVACCPAEAVAAAARMAGWLVTGQDVLDLNARRAGGPSSGFTIAAALAAASRWGVSPFECIDKGAEILGREWREVAAFPVEAGAPPLVACEGVPHRAAVETAGHLGNFGGIEGHALILGAAGGGDSNSHSLPLSPAAGAPRQHFILGVELLGRHASLDEPAPHVLDTARYVPEPAGALIAADETAAPSPEPAAWPAPVAERAFAVTAHPHALILGAGCPARLSPRENGPWPSEPADAGSPPALILGVDLPGPHAVTVAPDGCRVSRGRHCDPAGFPDAVVEEARAVMFA